MNTPVYIVTGATGGIGEAIVAALSADHAPCHIILAVRSAERGNIVAARYSSPDVSIEVRLLDLASLSSVRDFVRDIVNSGTIIKALINNAGIMPGGVTVTDDGMEIATQTNFVSTVLLTHLLIPAIADGGAIVFTTSVTRYLPRLRRDWQRLAIERHQRFITYGRSKLMLTHFALELARQLAPRGIRVNCSDPGVADTGIIRLGHPVVDRLADWIVRPIIHTPQQGATAALRAMDSDTTATIFTLRGSRPIPSKWLDKSSHKRLIADMQQYFRRYEKFG
ncbi:MAG: SDR family NAD(P)-dependent oxidoreductase [Muribaculum sp.]|nr:SDR family NAD(P)-dependent oxidoreductase [Muribaculum sp.]